jgi:SAM-dependent methyltransferase
MHPSVMNFVGAVVAEYDLAARSVLEVGSFDVNGSVRPYFTGPYLGTDMQPGPGVDEVMLAAEAEVRYPDGFDVCVCTEMLEHDEAPWGSLASMRAAVVRGGFLILTARGYDERGCFPLHGFPLDLWRFSVQGMRCLLDRTGWKPQLVEKDPEHPGVFAVARRP